MHWLVEFMWTTTLQVDKETKWSSSIIAQSSSSKMQLHFHLKARIAKDNKDFYDKL